MGHGRKRKLIPDICIPMSNEEFEKERKKTEAVKKEILKKYNNPKYLEEKELRKSQKTIEKLKEQLYDMERDPKYLTDKDFTKKYKKLKEKLAELKKQK